MSFNQSDLHASCIIKNVGATLNFHYEVRDVGRSLPIVARAIPAPLIDIEVFPYNVLNDAIDELKGNAICCRYFAIGGGLSVRNEVVPLTVDIEPTGSQNTELGVVIYTIDLNQTGVLYLTGTYTVFTEVVVELAGTISGGNLLDTGQFLARTIVIVAAPTISLTNTVNVFLTIRPCSSEENIAGGAFQDAVDQSVAVACCGNGRAPLHHGFAYLAVGAAGIAFLGAGRRLVSDGRGGVDVAAVPSVVVGLTLVGGDHILRHLVHLGIHLRAFTREGIGGAINEGDDTTVDIHADVDGPELLHALKLRVSIGS